MYPTIKVFISTEDDIDQFKCYLDNGIWRLTYWVQCYGLTWFVTLICTLEDISIMQHIFLSHINSWHSVWLSWHQTCHDWWHWRLSLWQPPVPPVMTNMTSWWLSFPDFSRQHYIEGLVQEWSNSSVLAMELRLSCTKPLICFIVQGNAKLCFLIRKKKTHKTQAIVKHEYMNWYKDVFIFSSTLWI